MAPPHLQEESQVAFLGEHMEGGTVDLRDEAIKTAIHSLTGIQIPGDMAANLGDLGKILSMMDFLEVVP